MRQAVIVAAIAILPAGTLFAAQEPSVGGQSKKMTKAAENAMKPLIEIVKRWVFPAVAFASALYGVARGIKWGEWDFAVICMIAAVALGLLPTVLDNLFDYSNGK